MPGTEIALPAGGGQVRLQATINSAAPLDRIEVVSMGVVVHTGSLADTRQLGTVDVTLPVTHSGWYSVRAIGPERAFPVENTRPLAVTNPVYVIVGSQPIRDRASAEYFVKWIDLLSDMANAHPGWRSARERAHVLGQFAEARAIYEQRAREGR
jgi:hypothetical protein